IHMHVASTAVFDPSTVPGGYSFEKLVELVESRLHLLPPFRRRLKEVPFQLHHPLWIEDPDFDIENHVHRAALPAPGGAQELADFAADVFSRPLDRTRPLWQMYVVEGLEHGHIASITKTHHAAIDGRRRFAFTEIPLDEAKMVKNALGGTVNDVVLALCAGALRNYLLGKGVLPEKGLVAMVPISVRTEDQQGAMGNRVSSMLTGLATDVEDPVERLHLISAGTRRAKDQDKAIGADTLTDWTEFAAPALAARAARLYSN